MLFPHLTLSLVQSSLMGLPFTSARGDTVEVFVSLYRIHSAIVPDELFAHFLLLSQAPTRVSMKSSPADQTKHLENRRPSFFLRSKIDSRAARSDQMRPVGFTVAAPNQKMNVNQRLRRHLGGPTTGAGPPLQRGRKRSVHARGVLTRRRSLVRAPPTDRAAAKTAPAASEIGSFRWRRRSESN